LYLHVSSYLPPPSVASGATLTTHLFCFRLKSDMCCCGANRGRKEGIRRSQAGGRADSSLIFSSSYKRLIVHPLSLTLSSLYSYSLSFFACPLSLSLIYIFLDFVLRSFFACARYSSPKELLDHAGHGG
jgi:hypothetical protein